MSANYTEDSIKSLDWKEHIRLRPGMYIGKLGDGSSQDDGIYILLKEVIDNSIDEFVMGHGKIIEVNIDGTHVSVRDYGRGIPLGKLKDCASKINTGAKYDSEAFKKSVGLNGVGIKAVNALSKEFEIQAYREGKTRCVAFAQGEVTTEDKRDKAADADNGTALRFDPDPDIFGKCRFREDYVEDMLWNYAYLNSGLTIVYNGKKFKSDKGLHDLLENKLDGDPLYPIIHLKDKDVEIAFTHASGYGEDYYSFVNGQHTTMGGTHLAAFREALAKTVKDFYKKDFDAVDIRTSICAAVSVKVEEPVFESQTKTKLGSLEMGPKGPTVRTFMNNFIKQALDNYLHRSPETAKELLSKIQESERNRKELKGIQKLARERAKKAKIHNKKLRDCRIHLDTKKEGRLDSTLFITEGDSASGSITKARDVNTQAVFSLKGKPLNSFGLTKKVVYENEEFNLLQDALNIEDGLDGLRYNNVVIATDADVDGMHIRLLLITFFLQFFPELIRQGHLHILQTPLFRVRNKKVTRYCYSDEERLAAIEECKPKPEITRFKGLGEISPDEFSNFIGKNIRLDPVIIPKGMTTKDLLTFYMGKNTPERQEFIIENLRIEKDAAEPVSA
ncbi:DNA topoisomerase IV subunit B [Coraliomargarita akajimensis]|uniref:DNA topoisomerase (ATP-hydrolyzing) n=1 Tax=Coraliomargarita akajimensis (strain DSM 45221 / IAM 15411 / JCM 23193 / KCTC 12865 / 04OKA010-24) TaxID=583355 RepID=D5EIV8_CORAD|nr:DNA topoisomerase IV subunit B [Coraliomargarita akajimensis]ADE54357.1 DNA topoisomerase type IIA subunit B region 2 domain protein [Coraliomargarita akajimensis DSM 45221]